MRLNKVSPRWLAACALAVALAVALCIPAVSLAVDYKVSIRSGAPSVYTAQPVNVGGYVAPTAANKYVTMQYRKSGWPLWKSVRVKANAKSQWKYKFSSGFDGKHAGKYYFRAKYSGATSKAIAVTVKERVRVLLASTTSTADSGS